VLYFCNNDNSSSYDWYAIKHTYEIIPGLLTCGYNYINDYGYSKQRWCDTTLDNPLLIVVSPETIQEAEEEPISVYAYLSAPSSGCPGGGSYFTLGSYTLMRNTSDSEAVIARWKMEFTNSEARENIRSMVPGSLCRVDEPSTPGEYTILRLFSEGYFTNGATTELVSYFWTIIVEY
jgi:hypothetical protein